MGKISSVMREIKFRAWNGERWYEYSLSDLAHGMAYHEIDVDCIRAWVQYTGLKDMLGKEIYEGDIMDREGVRFDVAWDDVLSCWMVWPVWNDGPQHLFEVNKVSRVCGNNYENPKMIGHITVEGHLEVPK